MASLLRCINAAPCEPRIRVFVPLLDSGNPMKRRSHLLEVKPCFKPPKHWLQLLNFTMQPVRRLGTLREVPLFLLPSEGCGCGYGCSLLTVPSPVVGVSRQRPVVG